MTDEKHFKRYEVKQKGIIVIPISTPKAHCFITAVKVILYINEFKNT